MERTVMVRRIKTGSVFRVLGIGFFFSVIPFALLMGVLALFDLGTVNWNGRAMAGIPGLIASPLVGLFLAAFFTGIGGLAVAFGLWVYSKFRPLRLQYVEDVGDAR